MTRGHFDRNPVAIVANAVQERVQAAAQLTLERYASGASIIGVVLDANVPPDEVVDAFRLTWCSWQGQARSVARS